MAIVLLRANVAYPLNVLEELKRDEAKLKEAGMLGGSSAVSADAHNVVYFMLTWRSVEQARRYWGSPDAKRTIEKLKSVEEPEVLILEDAKQLPFTSVAS